MQMLDTKAEAQNMNNEYSQQAPQQQDQQQSPRQDGNYKQPQPSDVVYTDQYGNPLPQ